MKPTLAFPIPDTPELDLNEIWNLSEAYENLPYAKESECQVLDLYLPAVKKEAYPLIIYIHEGAFLFGSKRDRRMHTLFQALEQGYAIASIDYRKADRVTWPAPVYDVKTAIRFLRANAQKYHLNTKQFAVWGMSAGAYYAAMAAVTNGIPGFEDSKTGYGAFSSDIQAVVDISGACSGFHHMDEEIRENGFGRSSHNEINSPESILMGAPLQEIRELCEMASPVTYINEHTPPFFVWHSKGDPVVPVQQSEKLVEAIRYRAGKGKVKAVFTEKEADHGKPVYDTGEIVTAALAFLEEVFQTIG